MGATGRGAARRVSRTRCACSVLRMNQPAKRRPTVLSATCTMFYIARKSSVLTIRIGWDSLYGVLLTSLITKSMSLVTIICPLSRLLPLSPPTREIHRLAALTAIICCTISSSSASRKFASFGAPTLVYSLRKLRSVGTVPCAAASARKSERCRRIGSAWSGSELSVEAT